MDLNSFVEGFQDSSPDTVDGDINEFKSIEETPIISDEFNENLSLQANQVLHYLKTNEAIIGPNIKIDISNGTLDINTIMVHYEIGKTIVYLFAVDRNSKIVGYSQYGYTVLDKDLPYIEANNMILEGVLEVGIHAKGIGSALERTGEVIHQAMSDEAGKKILRNIFNLNAKKLNSLEREARESGRVTQELIAARAEQSRWQSIFRRTQLDQSNHKLYEPATQAHNNQYLKVSSLQLNRQGEVITVDNTNTQEAVEEKRKTLVANLERHSK